MKKLINILENSSLIAIECCFIVLGIFLAVFLPLLNCLRPTGINLLLFSLPLYIYSFIVGMLFLISAIFIARRRPVGLKLVILANVLGIPFLVPIVLGLISLVLFNRPEIKAQFKK